MLWGFSAGEMHRLVDDLQTGQFGGSLNVNTAILALTVNGAIAFGLNYVSFTANGKTSPLMMCVAGTCFHYSFLGNMKQVLSIVLSVTIFSLTVNFTNSVGIVLTLVGGAWYTVIEMKNRSAKAEATQEHIRSLKDEDYVLPVVGGEGARNERSAEAAI